MHLCAAMCVRERVCAFIETFSSAHLGSTAVHTIVPLPSERPAVGGKGRVADCHASTYNLKWANAAVETRCLPTVSIRQQLQRPTNERVLLADLHVELWSLFVTSGKLAS